MEGPIGSHVLLVLLDGIGIPPPGRVSALVFGHRFFARLSRERIVGLPSGGIGVPVNADLGTPGLPQSATGHTSILTGLNAAQAMGRHVCGFPTFTLRKILQERNILKDARTLGLQGAYVNGVRPLHHLISKRGLKSAMAIAAESVGQKLMGLKDVASLRALYHDFTNGELIKRGERLPRLKPKEAGRILARIAMGLNLSLYEYCLTDLVGHSKDQEMAMEQVVRLEEFIEGILEEMDLKKGHLLICSDHGNLEDLSVRTHTMNPVPLMLWGPRAYEIGTNVKGIQDIRACILRALSHQEIVGGELKTW